MIKDLVNTLTQAKTDYYNSGTSVLTDSDFDKMEDELRTLDPTNNYFNMVGIEATYGKKVKHKFPMLSTAKAKTLIEVYEWYNRVAKTKSEIIIEPKIDGLSCSITYQDGILKFIATRGNGIEGQNISHLKDYLKIPKVIDKENLTEIKGELYLPKNTTFPNIDNKPLRNICSGIVNRKSDLEDLKYVKFLAYQLKETDPINKISKEENKVQELDRLGFDTIFEYIARVEYIDVIDEWYDYYLKVGRNKWPFETDGLVITINDLDERISINSNYVISKFNHYEIALKPPSLSKTTQLKDIEWNMSHHGSLIPTAIFDEITIGGANITRASLHNFKNVKDLNLQVGSKLEIERANDVIPYIKNNLDIDDYSETDMKLYPSKCPSCGGLISFEGVNLTCNTITCPEQKIQKIIYWCKKAEIKNFSEATIRTLFNAGFLSDAKTLFYLKNFKDEMLDLEGFGTKKIDKFIEEINKSATMNLHQFVDRLGILLVGTKAMEKLEINTFLEFWDFEDKELVIGQNLIEYRNAKKLFLFGFLNVNEIKVTDMKNKEDSKGIIAMTGKGPITRNDMIKVIEDNGYEFAKSVSKSTDILLCEDSSATSVKLEKARKNGTETLSYNDFLEKI